MSWLSLPAETRLQILENLSHEYKGDLARFSPVCNEWRDFVAKKIFRHLNLRASNLHQLNRRTSRHRRFVKHICLRIVLPDYDCRSCRWDESGMYLIRNEEVAEDAIYHLFDVLSQWAPADELTLELSVSCPSDSRHWFKHLRFDSEDTDPSYGKEIHSNRYRYARKNTDHYHGWVDGHQVRDPPVQAVRRLFSGLNPRFEEGLPEVSAVTRFMIRRQSLRPWCPSSLQVMLAKLPRVVEMVHERWRAPGHGGAQVYPDKKQKILVETGLPRTLKKLSLFEDSNAYYLAPFQKDPYWTNKVTPLRIAEPTLGAAFAHRSLCLTQLSISFMIDARHFFQACQQEWTWSSLQSLTLTSQCLTISEDPSRISDLLWEAGITAFNMPSLHTMILWNGGAGEACAFKYKKSDISITWCGTWAPVFHPRVLEAWERTVFKSTGSTIRVKEQAICGYIIKSHGDAISYLDLPQEVIDPMSLRHMREEIKVGT